MKKIGSKECLLDNRADKMKIKNMKFDLADILCIKCLLLIGCYHVYGSGPEDILKSDHKHRTHKAAERANELWCYQCFTMDINKEYCMNVTRNESSIQRKCDNDLRTCMVKRVSYTTTTNSTASVHKVWSLERNCTQKCESGCIIIGERLKLYKCTSCCEGKNFCNRGNEGSVNFQRERTKIHICSTCCESSLCNTGKGESTKLVTNKYIRAPLYLIIDFLLYKLLKNFS